MNIEYARTVLNSVNHIADLAFRETPFGLNDIYYRKADSLICDIKMAASNGCPVAMAAMETGKFPLSTFVDLELGSFEERTAGELLAMQAGAFGIVFDLDDGFIVDMSEAFKKGDGGVEYLAYAIRDLHEMRLESLSSSVCMI